MESNANAGDDDSSFAFKLPEGYFVSQTPRVELLGGAAMHRLPPPLFNQEAIEREYKKERIRQEILAREMAERRILEEEVRRELEIERIMETRFHMERYSALAKSSDLVISGDRPTQLFMPTWHQARSGASLVREHVHDAAEFAFRERSLSHMVAAQSSFLHKPEKSSITNEITALNSNLSGAKRNAHEELLPPAEKHWGCAICKVSSTSEKGLEAHLQGKRHRTMVLQSSKSLLPISKINLTSQSEVASSSEHGNMNQSPLNGATASDPENIKQPPLKGASPSKRGKKQQTLFCRLCRVKCNSQKMLEVHLNGKKHKMFIELKEYKKVPNRDETVAMNEEPNEESGGPNEESSGPNEELCGPNKEPGGPIEGHVGQIKKPSGPKEEHCGPSEEPCVCGPNEEPCGSNEEACVPIEEACVPNEEFSGSNEMLLQGD